MFHRDTSDDHHQLAVIDSPPGLVGFFIRELKSTLFQAFIEQDKSTGFPAKHFETVALFVDENKQIAAHGILVHLAGDNPAQPVKAFAHVGWLAIEKIPSVADGKHYLK